MHLWGQSLGCFVLCILKYFKLVSEETASDLVKYLEGTLIILKKDIIYRASIVMGGGPPAPPGLSVSLSLIGPIGVARGASLSL